MRFSPKNYLTEMSDDLGFSEDMVPPKSSGLSSIYVLNYSHKNDSTCGYTTVSDTSCVYIPWLFHIIATTDFRNLETWEIFVISCGKHHQLPSWGPSNSTQKCPSRRDGRSRLTLGPRKPLRWWTVAGLLAMRQVEGLETQQSKSINGWLVSYIVC